MRMALESARCEQLRDKTTYVVPSLRSFDRDRNRFKLT